jgi:ribosomal protein L11
MIKIKKKKKVDSVDDKNFKYLSFYLKAKSATISPPLSSVLGNIGVNTGNFAKEFNNLTDSLQPYM